MAALADLDRALSLDPRSAQAHLTRSAIYQVQGNYAAAAADCRSLMLTAPALTTADCMSRVISHRGQAPEAYRRLSALHDRMEGIDARQLKEVDLTLADIATRLGDAESVREGVWHIWIGYDHILFLLALLIPAGLRARKDEQSEVGWAPLLKDVLILVRPSQSHTASRSRWHRCGSYRCRRD